MPPTLPPPRLLPFLPHRTFTTTPPLSKPPKTNILRLLSPTAPPPPPYPYAPRHTWYKQAQSGLYGGHKIQHGNNVSEQNEIKTRRTFHPNVQRKRVYSRALDRHLRLRLTTRVLRTLDRVGGVDAYVLGPTPARLRALGHTGWLLRWAVLQTAWARETMGEAAWRRAVEGTGPGALEGGGMAVAEGENGYTGVEQEDGEMAVEEEEGDVVVEFADAEEGGMEGVREERAAFMEEEPAPPKARAGL